MSKSTTFQKAQTIVVKVGSSLVTNNGKGINHQRIGEWAAQIAGLRRMGKQVVMVSSGAVAQGMVALKWSTRPTQVQDRQAAAAVGQMGLAQTYEEEFHKYGIQTAQLLLTHADLAHRSRYINARNVIVRLLELGVMPIVNENDSIVTKEIKFGDNDTLGALVTNAIDADLLVILTDQDGLYDSDPRSNPDAKFIDCAKASETRLIKMAGGAGSNVGTGGMATKVLAAKRAALSGSATIIASGHEPDILVRLAKGEKIGTELQSDVERLPARKQWIADHLHTAGQLILDKGAAEALSVKGRSLLPIGVVKVKGIFKQGDVVSCMDEEGNELARGMINFSHSDADRIAGKTTEEVKQMLGDDLPDYTLIHRNNMVISEEGM